MNIVIMSISCMIVQVRGVVVIVVIVVVICTVAVGGRLLLLLLLLLYAVQTMTIAKDLKHGSIFLPAKPAKRRNDINVNSSNYFLFVDVCALTNKQTGVGSQSNFIYICY